MNETRPGYVNRMLRRLTTDAAELDADELSQNASESGARAARDCAPGQAATLLGRLRSVEMCPREEVATLEAELFDGTDAITLVWLGRRRIPGIEPGQTVLASGRVAERDGDKVIYNPYYELRQAP